jgi:hypothetical protein
LVGVPWRVLAGTGEATKTAEFLRRREEQEREIFRKWSDHVSSMYEGWIKSCFVSSEPEADSPVIVEEKK